MRTKLGGTGITVLSCVLLLLHKDALAPSPLSALLMNLGDSQVPVKAGQICPDFKPLKVFACTGSGEMQPDSQIL